MVPWFFTWRNARMILTWQQLSDRTPQDWANCIHLFRLGLVAHYADTGLGIRYREDHAAAQQAGIWEDSSTDPGDLFLYKVMDERRGTCGNMAALHWVLGRRLGWPVTLTLTWSHFLVRFDNGQVRWNAEASSPGGAVSTAAPPDPSTSAI